MADYTDDAAGDLLRNHLITAPLSGRDTERGCADPAHGAIGALWAEIG